MAQTIELDTPRGVARVHLHEAKGPAVGAVLLGHGAGGGVDAPDILAATGVAQELGYRVALVEQPYRIAGRRAPAPAKHLDEALTSVVQQLKGKQLKGLPLVIGGRSMGARVACRVAPAVGAVGVLCLAFPLVPPRRKGATEDPPSRLPELEGAGVPTLVVQGERDPFGMPGKGRKRTVAVVAGDHSLKKDLDAVRDAVRAWLAKLAA